jgi:hypothetical protein
MKKLHFASLIIFSLAGLVDSRLSNATAADNSSIDSVYGPGHAPKLVQLGNACLGAGDYQCAYDYAELAIEAAPDNADARALHSAAKLGLKKKASLEKPEKHVESGTAIPFQNLSDDDEGLGCFNPFGQNTDNNHKAIVIDNAASYLALAKSVKDSCKDDSPKLVKIDFSKNIVIGIKTVMGHSDAITEKYDRIVKRDDLKKKIIYHVIPRPGNHCGFCYSFEMNWISIPIPPPGYSFEIWADTPEIGD